MRFISLMCAGLVICGAGAGCVVTKIHTVPVKDFRASYDDVWDGVLTYLNREQEPVLVSDKDKGLVSTDWVIMEKVFSAKRYRYEINVIRINENDIRVAIASPQEVYEMGDWEPILPTERRAQRIFRFIGSYKPYIKTSRMVSVTSGVSDRPFNKIRRGTNKEK